MPREPRWEPAWKPFLNRRETCWRYRMRPVPVVFLRLAFSDQLSDRIFHVSLCPPVQYTTSLNHAQNTIARSRSGGDVHFRTLAAGYPHEAQVLFWMWSERRPVRSIPMSAFSFVINASRFILPQELPPFSEFSNPYVNVEGRVEGPPGVSIDVPHRRHRVCDLLWRLPKLEVPFAIRNLSIFSS